MSDVASAADSDSAAFCDSLVDDRYIDVFIRVIVIHDQHRAGHEYIVLDVDLIFGGNDAARTDCTVVLDYDNGLTMRVVDGRVEPCPLPQRHGISKADPGGSLAIQLARKMKRQIASLFCERIGVAYPDAIEFGERPRHKVQRVLTKTVCAIIARRHALAP